MKSWDCSRYGEHRSLGIWFRGCRVSWGRASGLLALLLVGCALLVVPVAQASMTPEVEPNDSPLTATPLNLSAGSAAATGDLVSGIDLDYFSFQAPPGARVWILVDTGTNWIGGDPADSYLTLFASNGQRVLEEDDDDGTGNGCGAFVTNSLASAISGCVLTNGGTYYVRIESYDGGPISGYTLLVALTTTDPTPEVEPNDTLQQANSIVTLGAPIGLRSGLVSPTNDVDLFKVGALAGNVLFISADCDPDRLGGTYLGIDLLATNGTLVLYSTEPTSRSATVAAARSFCFAVPQTGTYYVRVRRGLSSGASTAYRLMVASRGPGALQFGDAVFRHVEGGGSATVTVVRVGGSLGTVTVRFDTGNGTATAPGDYTTVSRLLSFPDGVTLQSVVVPILNDTLAESNETVRLTLSSPTGGAGLGEINPAVLAILDDDEPPNNSPATARAMDLTSGFAVITSVTGTIPAAISPPGDADWYSFQAPPGASVWAFVDTGASQNPAANSRDSVLMLFAADGSTLIEEDDDDGSGNSCDSPVPPEISPASAIAGRALNAGGTYYLRVSAFAPHEIIDPYKLFLALTPVGPVSEIEPNDEVGFANPLVTASAAVGQRMGYLTNQNDADFYSIVAPSNGVLYVSADADPYRVGGGPDVILEVYSTDGTTRLYSADASGVGTNTGEAFVFCPPAPGTYFLRVRSLARSGPYVVMAVRSSAEFEPNGSPGSAVPVLALDQFVRASGSISPAADTDTFSFVAPPGARLWATVDTGGAQSAGATSRDSILALLAADGASVIEQDDNDGSGNGGDSTLETGDASAIAGRALSAGGNYFLRVNAAGSGVINPYSIYVVVTTSAASAEREPNDSTDVATPLLGLAPAVGLRAGTLTAGDADYYSLAAWGGNLLHLSADGDPERDGTGTDLIVDLIAPDGSTVLFTANSSGTGSFSDPAAEGFVFRVPVAGTYWVRVRGSGPSAGTYQLLAARDNTLLEMVVPEVVGNDVRIRFPSQPNRQYQLDRMHSLVSPPAWVPVQTLQGTGGVLQFLEVGGASLPHRFYRVLQVP